MADQPTNAEIIASLAGMLESYQVATNALRVNPVAVGCLYGSFITEIPRCQDLIRRLKAVKE